MEPPERRVPAVAAGAAFALAALSYLPAARFLHYASFSGDVDPARLAWVVPLAIAGAFVFERIVRGSLYGWLRRRLPPGLAAPSVAALAAAAAALVLRESLAPHRDAVWGA